jgi:molybdopterin molybdotransferase
VRADFAYRKRPGRREYVRASLARDGEAVVASKYPKDGAGILTSITRSDGFVIIDEAAEGLSPGAMVDFLPYAEVIG